MKRRFLIFFGLFGIIGKLKVLAQQTQVADSQVAQPLGISAFYCRTPTGRRFIEPDASIVIDLVSIPNRVRATSGPGTTFMDNVVPTGTIDGINKTFSLSNIPSSNSLHLFNGGIYQKSGTDYNLTTNQISFIIAPTTGAILIANYRV